MPAAAQSQTFAMDQYEMAMDSKYLGRLRDCNALLNDVEALRARMAEDGYLLIRGLHAREKVAAARAAIIENLRTNGQIDENFPLQDAVVKDGANGAFLGGREEIAGNRAFLDVVESPAIMGFFDRFLGKPTLTYDYKWVRAVKPGGNTGAHYDVVYMGRGSKNLYTCWTPLGDIPMTHGTLAVLVGSHNLPAYKKIQETYGQSDVDRDHTQGWLTRNPIEMVDTYGGQWQTTDFAMGDVIVFGMFTMHGSLNNTTNRYRISCDTRYQPADEPADDRWVGKKPKAHYAWHSKEIIPVEVSRKEWGI